MALLFREVLVRGVATASLFARWALLRLFAGATALREFPVARTAVALATRAGLAEVRVLRSTAGRYRFTDRLSTCARPGRLAAFTFLTEIRLRVTRSSSDRPGPLT